MKPASELWKAALGEIELQINRPNFQTWFSKTTGVSYENGEFFVGAPNAFVVEYLDKNQRSLIEKTIIGLTSANTKVRFQVGTEPKTEPSKTCGSSNGSSCRLNPTYTFDSFVVGGNNRMAHASAISAAQNPGGTYNPLFIYGDVGLGKTHLLQAVGHTAIETGAKVLFVSSERFTNDFITAVREGQSEKFREKYRSVDVLLIDDVHFIGGKSSTEECFFHTFNELHQTNRQIVLTSNCPPNCIPQMEDRLRSRFEWGLTIEIKRPNLSTRLAILSSKAMSMGIEIQQNVLEYIAHKAPRSVRELEGCLNRVAAYAKLVRLPITIELSKEALTDVSDRAPDKTSISSDIIIETVAAAFNITKSDVLGRKRDKETALARQVAMHFLKSYNNCSLTEIGTLLGGRSPSTVGHACEKIESDSQNNPFLLRKMNDIKAGLFPGI